MNGTFGIRRLPARTCEFRHLVFNEAESRGSTMLMFFIYSLCVLTCVGGRIFDEDGSGSVDFREFVMSLWNYCTLSKAALIMFAFDLYDNDNSGEIDIMEVELLLREVRLCRRYSSAMQQSPFCDRHIM